MSKTSRRVRPDSHQYDPPPKRTAKRLPLWALALLAAVPLAVGGAGVGGVLWLRAAFKQADAKLMTREEFRAAVIDKTPDEVRQAVGVPNETTEFGSATSWVYRWRTKDPVTGKTDPSCGVTFQRGKVISVNF